MAVSVDKVYKTVLYILNKEQRGYMTPDEFDKVGQQVQLEIFENYFEELNQQLRTVQIQNEFSERLQQLEDKISTFEVEANANWANAGYYYLPPNVHRIGTISYSGSIVQPMQKDDLLLLLKVPLSAPSKSYPVYVQSGQHQSSAGPPPVLNDIIYVYPDGPTGISGTGNVVKVNYIKKPDQIKWNYTVLANGAYQYSPAGTVEFEVDASEQTELIINILMYSGIIIRDPAIIQTAAKLAQQDTINEKS